MQAKRPVLPTDIICQSPAHHHCHRGQPMATQGSPNCSGNRQPVSATGSQSPSLILGPIRLGYVGLLGCAPGPPIGHPSPRPTSAGRLTHGILDRHSSILFSEAGPNLPVVGVQLGPFAACPPAHRMASYAYSTYRRAAAELPAPFLVPLATGHAGVTLAMGG